PTLRSNAPVLASCTTRRWVAFALAISQVAPSAVVQVARESSSSLVSGAVVQASAITSGAADGRAASTAAAAAGAGAVVGDVLAQAASSRAAHAPARGRIGIRELCRAAGRV